MVAGVGGAYRRPGSGVDSERGPRGAQRGVEHRPLGPGRNPGREPAVEAEGGVQHAAIVVPDAVRRRAGSAVEVQEAIGVGQQLDGIALPLHPTVGDHEVLPMLTQPRGEEVRLVDQHVDRPLQ